MEPSTFAEHLHSEAGAFFNVVQPALTTLRHHRGSVVAVTTAATDRYVMRDGLSTGPKAAVEGLIRGLAVEEGRYGVRFNAVGPGMLGEGMVADLVAAGEYSERDLDAALQNIPLRTFGSATDVAEAVCFLVSDRARYVSGQILNVDGGYTA